MLFFLKYLADRLGCDTIRAALVRSFHSSPIAGWSGVRVAEGARLESMYTARYRGFREEGLSRAVARRFFWQCFALFLAFPVCLNN